MTEKRYDVIDKEEPRGQSVTWDGIPCTARTCVTRLNRLTEENEQLKSDRVRFEEETRLEITRVMDKIFELIDKKIEFYKHKPVSAPISNPANPNYDEDVDRLARLSELEDLKETLKELSE